MKTTGRDLTLRFDIAYPKGDNIPEESTRNYLKGIIDKGNRILQLDPTLSADSSYQPSEYSNIGQLIERLTTVIFSSERRMQAKEKAYVGQAQELKTENASLQRRLEEEREKVRAHAGAAIQMTKTIDDLEMREPIYSPNERYDQLKRSYDELESGNQELTAEKSRLSGKVQRLAHDLEAAKSRNKERQELIEVKNTEIKRLEGEYGVLQQKIESLTTIPTLEKIYGKKSILFVTGFYDQIPKYKKELDKVFGYVEVVAPDEVKRQNPQNFDVIMMAGGLTRHPDRFLMESQGNKVIVYPNQPNQVLQFLYDRNAPKQKNGK